MTHYTATKDIYELDSTELIKLGTLGPGTYKYRINMRGNSLLSTLYVKSKDPGATVSGYYYDVTTGENFGEETFLKNHNDVAAGETDRIFVSNLHNKPVLSLVITGGNVEFSVFNTVLPSSFSAIDSALVFDGEDFVLIANKALPGAALDELSGELKFLRAKPDGSLIVSTSPTTPANTFFREFDGLSDPGTEQTLLNVLVPANTRRVLTAVRVTTRQSGTYKVMADAVKIASGRLDSRKIQDDFTWTPNRPIAAGVRIKLFFETYSGRPVSKLEAYLMGYDEQV